MSEDAERQLRLEQLNDAFRPAGPVDQERLFAGRVEQRERVAAAVSTPGQHVAIYGERGIGKTSLAAVSVASARSRSMIALRVNCNKGDDFQLIWDSAVDQVIEQRDMPWWNSTWDPHVDAFVEIMGRDSSILAEPDRIRLALTRLSQATRVLIFFDEFDVIEDEEVADQMASTIKTLSDHLVDATVAIVGVAGTIDELIEGHQSIQRCLDQIQMPRMSPSETEYIVMRGLRELNMGGSDPVLHFINRVSMGFPQYAHLLGRSFAKCAIRRGSDVIQSSDLHDALTDAVSGVQQSISTLYNSSVFSPNRKAIYKQVLLACALASADSEGFFTPRLVADPLSVLLGRTVRSDTFNSHLKEFCESRGPLLEARGRPKMWRYRFVDPAMGPYVILLGAMDGLVRFNVSEDEVDDFSDPPDSSGAGDSVEQQPLF